MANIGIFGGSFNPPHRGHLLAAAEFQRRLGLDRVILMPAALPPHKALAAGSPDAHTRLELTRLAAQDLPFAEVSDLELHRSGASYTADTLEELHRQYPNDHLWFLMGTDMLLTFAQWHAPERIAKLASLAVAHRGRDDGRTLREAAQQLRDRFGADVVLVENDFLPYSSTIARAMLAFRCGEDYLEPAVYDAVCMQGLYHTRSDAPCRSMRWPASPCRCTTRSACRMCLAAVIRRQSLPPASGRIPARPGVPVCCTM